MRFLVHGPSRAKLSLAMFTSSLFGCREQYDVYNRNDLPAKLVSGIWKEIYQSTDLRIWNTYTNKMDGKSVWRPCMRPTRHNCHPYIKFPSASLVTPCDSTSPKFSSMNDGIYNTLFVGS
jgi:hypothetical protein